MDSKGNLLALLGAVERALAVTHFRNAYEAANATASNLERLDAASASLTRLGLSGNEHDTYARKIRELRTQVEGIGIQENGTGDTTSAEAWLQQLEEEALGEDEEGVERGKKPKKEKKEKKPKKEKESRQVETAAEAPNPRGIAKATKAPVSKAPEKACVLKSLPNCGFGAIPAEALEGRCVVKQLPNSPCVELYYDTPVAIDDSPEPATCVVVMYRVVTAALWRGVPLKPTQPPGDPRRREDEIRKYDNYSPLETADDNAEAGVGEEDVEGHSDEEMVIADTDEHEGHTADATLRECSEKLVQEYMETEAGDDAENFSRGRDAPTQIIIPTPHFRLAFAAPWTILMCHGGYFAGGVFVNGKATVHKAFQRYVVRKKQGGMQSKADKTGGVMKSAGSQIRRHNELKWKVMVRDILLQWKEMIDASWVILFVAPGPDNRAVLTDFGAIPASFGGGSTKGCPKSPIDLKDIRVRSAPLTTHRPTFTEVQRIFNEVSRVTVRYEERL